MRQVDSIGDTIVACATPPGEGAIAVVRLSGPQACGIARGLMRREPPARSHRMVYAALHDAVGRVLDRAMVAHMFAPRSYTGEDVVELYTHGSRAVVNAVVGSCLSAGARLARPGEFTLRAFLNGRMDLAQAEAVADLIVASSETQMLVAVAQLEGGLSRDVLALLEPLEGVLSRWRAALDFPEDYDGGVLPTDSVAFEANRCTIQKMLSRSRTELRQGLRVVLCGAPNTGKSTLLNVWAGRERVLVDAAPGTTRDPVEVELSQGPVRWSVCDTAGIRSGAAGLEGRGIGMSLDWIRQADVALWLLAADGPVWPPAGVEAMVVGSKADLAAPGARARLEDEARERGRSFSGWISPLTGEGTAELRERLLARLDIPIGEGETVVVRQRHVEALQRCEAALGRVTDGLSGGLTLDLLCMELEDACRALGEVIGRDVDGAVLDRIFAELCIGK